MQNRNFDFSDLLPDLLRYEILPFLSKQAIYSLFFVSKKLHALAKENDLYQKASGPWPKREYNQFKDEQIYEDYEPENSFRFKNGDLILLRQHVMKAFLTYICNDPKRSTTFCIPSQVKNVIWLNNSRFVILTNDKIVSWDGNTHQLKLLIDCQPKNITHLCKTATGNLLLVCNKMELYLIDPDKLYLQPLCTFTEDIEKIDTQDNTTFIVLSDTILFMIDDKIISALSDLAKIMLTTHLEHSLPSNNQSESINPKEFGRVSVNFKYAAPGFAFIEYMHQLFLMNLNNKAVLPLGKNIKTYGCLSNNDMFIVKYHKTIKRYGIHFGWDTNNHRFKDSYFCEVDSNSQMHFGSDKIVIGVEEIKESKYMSVKLFDFKQKTFRSINLNYETTVTYNVTPLDDYHLVIYAFPIASHSIKAANHQSHYNMLKSVQIFNIENTTELVYSHKFSIDYRHRKDIIKLESGNLAVLHTKGTTVLRFGLFNNFPPVEENEKIAENRLSHT